MNSGNCNRSPLQGQRNPHQTGFLTGIGNNFGGIPTTIMRSPTHNQIHSGGSGRNFSTSSNHFSGHGRTLENIAYQTRPPSTNGLINGIKNIVNGLINPKLNCDFHLDHNRSYNPNYRNNYKSECQHASGQETQSRPPEPRVQTVMFDLRIGAHCHQFPLPNTNPFNNSTNPCTNMTPLKPPISETEIVAIFTSEDFPELPLPKPFPSVAALWAKEKSPTTKGSEKCSPATDSPPRTTTTTTKPANLHPKCSYFEIFFTTGKKLSKPLMLRSQKTANKTKSQACPMPTTSTQLAYSRRGSEDCDSEDNLLIFANSPSPSQKFNLNNYAGATPFRAGCPGPAFRRQRQISECSDDSFVICFTDDGVEGAIEFSDIEDDDDSSSTYSSSSEEEEEEEEDTDESDDSDDDGDDCVDGDVNININLKTDRNKIGRNANSKYVDETNQFDSGFDEHVKKKKVRFDAKPPTMHVMHTWKYAYQSARKGHWENYARDRCRFKNRIERTSVYLNPVLQSAHREQIYKTRFSN